jgi:hypothetical protein
VRSATEVLAAMITPAVLISASGTLVLSTSNRLSRVVDRVRVLAVEAQAIQQDAASELARARQALVSDQLARLGDRALLLRSAMSVLYLAIGLLVATSIAVGLVSAVGGSHQWLPVTLGLSGALALLYGSLMLLREARLAVGSTLQEMAYVRYVMGAVGRPPGGAANG